MISREEIRSIPERHRKLEREREQLDYLREKAVSLGALATDKERVQTSPDPDAMKFVDAAIDLEREIRADETELIDLQKRAEMWIGTVYGKLPRKILRYKYINCYTWNQIGELLGYSERYLQQIESDALSSLN